MSLIVNKFTESLAVEANKIYGTLRSFSAKETDIVKIGVKYPKICDEKNLPVFLSERMKRNITFVVIPGNLSVNYDLNLPGERMVSNDGPLSSSPITFFDHFFTIISKVSFENDTFVGLCNAFSANASIF